MTNYLQLPYCTKSLHQKKENCPQNMKQKWHSGCRYKGTSNNNKTMQTRLMYVITISDPL